LVGADRLTAGIVSLDGPQADAPVGLQREVQEGVRHLRSVLIGYEHRAVACPGHDHRTHQAQPVLELSRLDRKFRQAETVHEFLELAESHLLGLRQVRQADRQVLQRVAAGRPRQVPRRGAPQDIAEPHDRVAGGRPEDDPQHEARIFRQDTFVDMLGAAVGKANRPADHRDGRQGRADILAVHFEGRRRDIAGVVRGQLAVAPKPFGAARHLDLKEVILHAFSHRPRFQILTAGAIRTLRHPG